MFSQKLSIANSKLALATSVIRRCVAHPGNRTFTSMGGTIQYALAAVVAAAALVSCGGDDAAPKSTGPVQAPPVAAFDTPKDSLTVRSRLLYMRLNTSTLPTVKLAVFYVDDVSVPAGVDDSLPFEYARYDPTWTHGSWHTLSALIETDTGAKFFTDTISIFFLPRELTDTLFVRVEYSRQNGHAYMLTRLPYSWNSFDWLKPWLEDDADAQWSLAVLTSADENDFATTLLQPGAIAWVGGYLDSSLVWKWYNGEASTYDNWPGPPPQNLTEDGLVLKSDGVWTDAARFASLPLIMEVSWAP